MSIALDDIPVFFRAPPGGAGYFSLHGQREVTKRKATPRTRPEHIPVLRMRERAPGFAEGTSMCLRRTGPRPAGHPSDCSVAPRRVRGAPFNAMTCHIHVARPSGRLRRSNWQSCRFSLRAWKTPHGAQDARLTGPLCCGEGRTTRPAGWARWIAPTCRRAWDGASASPAGPNGFFVHGWTKNAAPGSPSLWPLSLGEARESGPPAWRRAEKDMDVNALGFLPVQK